SKPAPCKPIEKLLAERENAHKSIQNLLKVNFQKVSSQITREIWLESKTLQICLTKMKDEMDSKIDVEIRSHHEELVKLNWDVFETMRNTIETYQNDRLRVLDRFHETLQNLERKRSNSFKSILNQCYKNMQKISFLMPSELLEYFENEILNINIITLNNYYYYSQVQSDLKLQTEDYIRMLLIELMDIEDKYKIAVKKVRVRGLVDIKYVDYGNFFDADNEVDICKGGNCNAKKLVSLYKMAVVNIFNRFFEELQRITDALIEESKSVEVQDISYINSEVYQPIIEEITQQYTCEAADLQNLWNSITLYMESNIKNTYLFLKGSAHLWEPHFARINECQVLILQDLKNIITKNDKVAQIFEKKINTAVDKLRQESILSKLNQHLAEANKVLDSVGKLISSQCEAEIKILEKYYKLVDQEVNVLLAEIERFLGEFSKNETIQGGKHLKKNGSEGPSIDEITEKLIPHQMKTCKYQVDAVNNWMFGLLWEAIRLYMITCRKELSEQAFRWVHNQATKLRKRQEVRMAMHKPRYTRVKVMVYDVRLKELEDHFREMDKLNERVDKYTSDARNFNHNYKEIGETILRGYQTQAVEVEEMLKSPKKSLQILACIHRANIVAQNTELELKENFQKNDEMAEENLKKIDQMICHAIGSVKLFSDGGNYSHEEAKFFIKKLNKMRKSVPKKYATVFEERNGIKAEIFQRFRNIKRDVFNRLERSKEEFQHNERVVMKIKELQNEIRRRAYAVKFRISRVDACIDYFATMSKFNLWKRKNFIIMKNVVAETLERISELTNYLIYNDENKAFYNGRGPIVNQGKIQPTYEAFMEEVLQNYNNYKQQIEIHCLECAEELTKHVLKLLKINDEIYEDMVNKYPHIVKNEGNYDKLHKKLRQESLQ
ncbi:uncharacterized protein BDFB_000525, partial [Asbolus verrucosus]